MRYLRVFLKSWLYYMFFFALLVIPIWLIYKGRIFFALVSIGISWGGLWAAIRYGFTFKFTDRDISKGGFLE